MFSFFRRKTKEFKLNEAICNCIRSLIVYRMRKDKAYQTELIAKGIHIEYADEIVSSFSAQQLKATAEYYIVYLIALYCDLESRAGQKYNYEDILYTIDQAFPKPKGYIPVQLWSPPSLSDYILYRISIDLHLSYPPFVVDDNIERLKSFLSLNAQ